jgi:lysophospholipase L1-like esterase
MDLFTACTWIALAAPSLGLAADGPFELHDGDRVVLLGDAFIERDQAFGELELALVTRWPRRRIVVRNLGWSGDNVFGRSRAGFGAPATDPSAWIPPSPQTEYGFSQLREQVRAVRPTVIFVAYGGNESYEGATGLEAFEAGYRGLLEALEETKARLVLLSPLPVEHPGPKLANSAADNARRRLYAESIRGIAVERGHRFVDLLRPLEPALRGAADHPPLPPGEGRGEGHQGDPSSPAARAPAEQALTDNGIHLNARGYRLAAQALSQGLGWTPAPTLESGRQRETYESLRRAILAKNELYFHRYRPQNNTYLFLFRKHEQGQNAKEIPLFDPLVAEQEREIARLLGELAPAE